MRTLAAGLLGLALAAPVASQAPTTVREDQIVVVDSIPEHWLLEWRTRPKPVCGPEDPDWLTCPCEGFAFGEMGALDLVRKRPGHADERLPLTPFFADKENPAAQKGLAAAVLRRWPVFNQDYEANQRPDFARRVQRRATASAMRFGDYDHDGGATEFLLLVDSGSCGHNGAVVVGVSRTRPFLHAFSSVAHPERPLMLDTRLWDTLLHARGPVTGVEMACGDHGSEEHTEVRLNATARGIATTRLVYQCTTAGKRGRLKETRRF